MSDYTHQQIQAEIHQLEKAFHKRPRTLGVLAAKAYKKQTDPTAPALTLEDLALIEIFKRDNLQVRKKSPPSQSTHTPTPQKSSVQKEHID